MKYIWKAVWKPCRICQPTGMIHESCWRCLGAGGYWISMLVSEEKDNRK